ncbi:MAG: sigma-54-dependent Fis family transcriptional regulator, partial [Deltaproteobacteria bacterium]
IDVEDIPLEYRKEDGHKLPLLRLPKEGLNLKAVVSEIEKNLIEQALAITNGNKNKAAELLQMNRTTLVEKIKRLF